MKKLLFSNSTHSPAPSLALLLLRLAFGGGMLLAHGWPKLAAFSQRAPSFPDPFGIGSAPSLALAVFAEVFCAALVSLGLLTRAALLPLLATMATAASLVAPDSIPLLGSVNELALLFSAAYLALLLAGPGKYSLDHLLR